MDVNTPFGYENRTSDCPADVSNLAIWGRGCLIDRLLRALLLPGYEPVARNSVMYLKMFSCLSYVYVTVFA
jgi:hypothetical protein